MLYKDKNDLKTTKFPDYKLRIVIAVVCIASLAIVSLMQLSNDSHENAFAKLTQNQNNPKLFEREPTNSKPPNGHINNGRNEYIDTSMDAKALDSISKEQKPSSNHASVHGEGHHIENNNKKNTKTSPNHQARATTTTKQFPTIYPTTQRPRESAEPDASKSKIVLLDQNRVDGTIKVVDRIDVAR